MGVVYFEVAEEVRHVAGETTNDSPRVALPPSVEGDGREVATAGVLASLGSGLFVGGGFGLSVEG